MGVARVGTEKINWSPAVEGYECRLKDFKLHEM